MSIKDRRDHKKRITRTPVLPAFPRVYETYRLPTEADIVGRGVAPVCFNGEVKFRRYSVNVRRIEEPVEVLRDRIIKLWRESKFNTHDTKPLREAMREIGFEPDEYLLAEERARDAEKTKPLHPTLKPRR